MTNTIYFADNLTVLQSLPSESVDLIYIDPPFNTGKVQARKVIKANRSTNGDRTGFGGRSYETVQVGSKEYGDAFEDYEGFLRPRLDEAYRVLTPRGSLYFHIDYREVHYCKIWLDEIFGRESFINEIIWAYDYGGKPRSRWPAKHDNILFYVKDPQHYTFNVDEIDREPYMAPGLVGPEKAARGKLPTDVWWHTIVSYQRQRENRLSYPKTAGRNQPHPAGFVQPRRPGAGFLCRERDGGRELPEIGAQFHPGR